MGSIAERGILGLTAGAKVEGLAHLGIHFVGGGLPTHRLIIEQSLENESSNCERWKVEGGRWKAGGRVLPILLIPIEKDAGWYIQGQLIALFQRAPTVLVGLFV